MNFLSVEKLSKSFGERVLFQDLTFGIEHGQKVGFIAPNGSGKSTLLNIILGKTLPDSGIVAIKKNLKIGYLEQNPDFQFHSKLSDYLYDSDYEPCKIWKSYLHSLENPLEPKDYQILMDKMEQYQVWTYENRLKEILNRLGLDWEMYIDNLSGGQKKKLALAKLLVNQPDLLILDEPTNHLDLDMIEWLENYLQQSSITLFLVTHDRYFLENVCSEILELFQGKLYFYQGNYQYYLEQKSHRHELFLKEIEKAQNAYRKELEWIRRQPKARTTKSKARIDAFYEIAEKAFQKIENKKVEIEINMERMGSKILEIHNISKSYQNKILFSQFTYKFKQGEKVGIIGKNGSGKSTFLKILMSEIEPDTGKVVWGDTIKYAYYSQEGLQVDENKRVIEVVKDIAEYIPLKKGRKLSAIQLLEKFLFRHEQHYTLVSQLSGGEKRRLYLVTLLMKNPNFLILDEPTNDLDIDTLSALEDFLDDFPGCILVVSHDRYFMDRVVEHLFVLGELDHGEIKDFPGNYTEFLAWKEVNLNHSSAKTQENTVQSKTSQNLEVKNATKKLSYKEQRELQQIEKELPDLEQKKKDLELAMNQNLTFEELQKISKEYELINEKIEEYSMRWLELSE